MRVCIALEMKGPSQLSHQAQHTLLRSSGLQQSVLRLLLNNEVQPSRIRKLADCPVLAAATGSGLLSSSTCSTVGKYSRTYHGRHVLAIARQRTSRVITHTLQMLMKETNIRHVDESTGAPSDVVKHFINIRTCGVHLAACAVHRLP